MEAEDLRYWIEIYKVNVDEYEEMLSIIVKEEPDSVDGN